MFTFSKKTLLAAGMLMTTMTSLPSYATNNNNNNDIDLQPNNQIQRAQKSDVVLPKDLKRSILIRVCVDQEKDSDHKPVVGVLRLVCREWRGLIDDGTQRTDNIQDLTFSRLGSVWQRGLAAFYFGSDNQALLKCFLEGKITLKNENDTTVWALKDQRNPFKAYISVPTPLESQYVGAPLVITTDVDGFNPDGQREKTADFLISTYHQAPAPRQPVQEDAEASVITWDPAVAPIGIFGRASNWAVGQFDQVTTVATGDLGNMHLTDLFRNHRKQTSPANLSYIDQYLLTSSTNNLGERLTISFPALTE